MPLSERFDQALVLASGLHRHQVRKGTAVPYVTHLLAVAALVGEAGGGEDEIIAALLHDAVEDQGGIEVLQEIRQRFGENVADIVMACSDTSEVPKPPWRQRKEAHLARMSGAPGPVLLVLCADKLHNARAMLRDLRQHGPSVWQRFRGGREGTLWYLCAALTLFLERDLTSPLVQELAAAIEELEAL